jgi:carbonic anhydrase
MDKMIDGYRRFLAKSWPTRRALFQDLAEHGQNPRAMVIACADSRVDPGMIFDAAPGEIFVVRNVANLVPPYAPDGGQHATSAALEFGVRVLKVPDLVVMGHAMCGGVRALLTGAPADAGDFLAPWISVARAARGKVLRCADPDEAQERCEQEVVKLSLDNLMTFPWIAEPVRAGTLRLHGMHFGIRSGVLKALHTDGVFRPV